LVVLSFSFAACGGSGFSSESLGNGDGSSEGGNQEASSTPDGSPSPQDASAIDDRPASGRDATGANDGAPSAQDASDASTDAPAAPCPDVRGSYAVTVVQALGCGLVSASAPQCIRQMACGITFRSMVSGGGAPAVNGDASLQSDGSFANAALTEGLVNRSGCTGAWDRTTSTMTVACGGTGSSQSCVLALKRTGTGIPCN